MDTSSSLKQVCRDFMRKSCSRDNCRFTHDTKLCKNWYRNYQTNGEATCKFGENCRKNHFVTVTQSNGQSDSHNSTPRRKPKNTECFEPMTTPVDMRVVFDLGRDRLTTKLTSRDVVLAPNLFSEPKGEIHKRLLREIEECNVPKDQLLKLWHGNDKIEGTHLIVNDRTRWKDQCPTFKYVIDRIQQFFDMDIQATRFNWYKDTSQWKPFHHDSAYVNPEKAKVQNFTVAVSFGVTRDAAFEHAKTKTVVSFPQDDGVVYCFANDTNGIWRHGILQDLPVRDSSRVSIICWGKVDGMGKVAFDN